MRWIKLQVIILFVFLCAHAHGFNSKKEWQTYKETNSMSVCFDQGFEKMLWDKSAWCNVTLPDIFNNNTSVTPISPVVSGNPVPCDTSGSTFSMVAETLVSLGGVGAITQILRFVNICTNGYVIAPHELLNQEYPNLNPPFTEYDIPYIFHCDPGWDPDRGVITVSDPRFGRTKGFATPSMPYCSNPMLTDAMKTKMKEWLYKVTFAVDPEYWIGVGQTSLAPGQESTSFQGFIRSYYNLDGTTGKLMLCVSTENIGGALGIGRIGEVILGCSPIAPPVDELFNCDDVYRDTRFSTFCTQQGRCKYLGTSREDLIYLSKKGLGGTFNNGFTSVEGPDGLFVKKFLESDFHITSVVVGCVQDLLIGLFSGPVNMFQQFQFNMHGMVLATLTLYLAYVAIKTLLRASNPLSRGEFVMYIVKFALVYAFAAGGAWYNPLPGSASTSSSLVASIIQIPNTMANWFLTAQNVNDPLNYCRLEYGSNKENLLSERSVATPAGGIDTNGSQGLVKLSVWDLVDCKLANYLTFGACDFSVGGLVSVWLIGACLFAFPMGIALAIIMIIYVAMLFYTVMRIAQIFILSLFAVTILVFVSPIFLLFWLFDYTKSIFDGWASMLLGYILYPALLFAFLALMLATFDSVFYGFHDPITAVSQYGTQCQGKESIFCVIYNHLNTHYSTIPNLCKLPFGSMASALIDSYTIPFIGKFYYTTPETIGVLMTAMVKIMLLAALFKFFMETMIGTLAAILGVIDLQDYAKGANFIKDVIKIAMKAGKVAASTASKGK